MADFNSINQAFVQMFDKALQHEAQQKESRLMRAVTDKGTITGESFTHNRLASVEMDDSNTRLAQTVLSPIDHSTRIATMKDFYKALALDEFDVPKMLINPVTGGDYMAVLLAAWNRKCDRIIYDALLGTVTLKSGGTVALPAGQKILAGGTGFTKAKVIQARKLFRQNEADNHAGEELSCIYTGEMLEDILSDTTLTSADFMAVKMLQEGDVASKWMGINWVPFENVIAGGGSSTTVMFTKRALKFGKGLQRGNVSPRPDLRDAIQVSMKGSAGAVRTDEDYVVQIDFTI